MTDLLTVPQAATVAGVSARTMRRWASSGQVRTVGRGHGRKVLAASLSEIAGTNCQAGQEQVSPMGDTAVTTATGSDVDVAAEADRLAALVRELADRLANQTALTAIWQERARILGERLALAAPVDVEQPREPPLSSSGATPASDAATEASEPWWRRLAGALNVGW